MDISINYKPSNHIITVWDYRRDELIDRIYRANCGCYEYDIKQTIEYTTLTELEELANGLEDNSYLLHGDDKECGIYQRELIESVES